MLMEKHLRLLTLALKGMNVFHSLWSVSNRQSRLWLEAINNRKKHFWEGHNANAHTRDALALHWPSVSSEKEKKNFFGSCASVITQL